PEDQAAAAVRRPADQQARGLRRRLRHGVQGGPRRLVRGLPRGRVPRDVPVPRAAVLEAHRPGSPLPARLGREARQGRAVGDWRGNVKTTGKRVRLLRTALIIGLLAVGCRTVVDQSSLVVHKQVQRDADDPRVNFALETYVFNKAGLVVEGSLKKY